MMPLTLGEVFTAFVAYVVAVWSSNSVTEIEMD